MRYQWSRIKDQQNREKHGLPLSAGISVFDDPYRIEQYDDRAYPEDRYITIGLDARTKLLYICYTMVTDDITRLISVRSAELADRRVYENQNRW